MAYSGSIFMDEISYKYWGLIPLDEAPSSGSLQTPQPPMMSVMALDQLYSLVFLLKKTPQNLIIQLEATAFSAENRGTDVLSIYTSTANDSFHQVTGGLWEKSVDNMYTLFKTEIENPDPFIKLHFPHAKSFIVNRVQFYE